MSTCHEYTICGSRCELPDGHDGKHRNTSTGGFTFEWTTEGQTRLADKHGSRFD